MYAPLLFIHSWTRWIVVVSGIYFLARCYGGWISRKTWRPSDNHFIWAFNQILGYQILFGLTLYLGASPWVKIALSNPSSVFTNPNISFWVARHAPSMLLSFGVFHLGRVRANRSLPEGRYRIYAITFTFLMAIIFSAVPWKGLVYGRPWFRWYF